MTLPNPVRIDELNLMNADTFESVFADIFEHSSWIARQACSSAPFATKSDLHAAMVNVVERADQTAQISLLRAHPELAGKEASAGQLTDLSNNEQSSVGMNALSADQMEEVKELNHRYRDKFGFPFIIAVRRNTREEIFEKWRSRLANDFDQELQTCLAQVYQIAEIRLNALIAD
jgi:2-oxo-4-hydroxy-4-carboxy-5-ureidoimidazoline decarboxylase